MPAFKLVDRYTYWWPVIVETPDSDHPGRFERQEFEMLFEAVSDDEVAALTEKADALMRAGDAVGNEKLILKRICIGWKKVEDTSGGDLPFNEETFAAALRFPWFRGGVLAAYRRSLGDGGPRLGN